ncbi:MAG: formate--tetrahydrofolate ligase [Gammaproteobacteria bacterium]|nr:formate--tetrahydrofolate ligase [Gammaproteobacteria bacterium]
MSDIEIARAATAQPIGEIADKIGIPGEALMPYGRTKAKIDPAYIDTLQERPDGKLILVTAITPTPAGAGFLVFVCGEIMTMPGLPRVPAADKIHIDDAGLIQGLF